MNIIISGWPAAGSTTLSVLMADLLEYKYLYGGGVMKHIARQVVGQESGEQYLEFEKFFGPYFDAIWEKYASWKIAKSDNMILDGKAGGFFVESENVFEVMVIAHQQVREKRAEKDMRLLGKETLAKRDMELRERWQHTYGIDIFDPRQIQMNYDLVMDNSNMNIESEINMMLNYLEEDYRFPSSNLSHARQKVTDLVKDYWQVGKSGVLDRLHRQKHVITVSTIFSEWQSELPTEFAQMPPRVQQIISEHRGE